MSRPSRLAAPAFISLLRETGPATDAIWLIGNTIGLGLTVVAAYAFPRYGVFFGYLAVMARCALYAAVGSLPRFSYYDLMLRLGLVAGLFEIFADAMLVRWLPTGGLVYLTRDAILLESPLYMPIAWACVIVEFGYVPLRLYGLMRAREDHDRIGVIPRASLIAAGVAMVTGAVVAGISIGLYEFLAYRAGWWKYLPAKMMIGPYCAAYIPLGESLMFAGILPVFASMVGGRDPRRRGAIQWGTVFAALIFVSYLVAYIALEGFGATS